MWSGQIVQDTLTSNCHPDGRVEISFTYEPATVVLDLVTAGTCGVGSDKITLQERAGGGYLIYFNTHDCGDHPDYLRQELDIEPRFIQNFHQ